MWRRRSSMRRQVVGSKEDQGLRGVHSLPLRLLANPRLPPLSDERAGKGEVIEWTDITFFHPLSFLLLNPSIFLPLTSSFLRSHVLVIGLQDRHVFIRFAVNQRQLHANFGREKLLITSPRRKSCHLPLISPALRLNSH